MFVQEGLVGTKAGHAVRQGIVQGRDFGVGCSPTGLRAADRLVQVGSGAGRRDDVWRRVGRVVVAGVARPPCAAFTVFVALL